ncbi:MAG: hypothetical protein VX874_00765 [Pseudomonadota bacterium]|nr:hypothetical protein [Pseudomonadota bacterium]
MTVFTASATAVLETDGRPDLPIIEKVRRGRLAALAALRARTADSANVVSLFEGELPRRADRPVFHTCRKPNENKLPPLLLTNPIAA